MYGTIWYTDVVSNLVLEISCMFLDSTFFSKTPVIGEWLITVYFLETCGGD